MVHPAIRRARSRCVGRPLRAVQFAVALAAGAALAACTARTAAVPPLPAPPHVQAAGPTVDRIRRAGALRIAADLSTPPMAFRADGAPAGFDVELAGLLAGALGVRLRVVDTPAATLRAGVPADADAVIGALPQGGVSGRVSAPYYTSRQAIVSPGRGVVPSLRGLRGLRVAAAVGTPGASVAEDAGAVVELTYLPAKALAEVASGRVPAAVVDGPAAHAYAGDHPGVHVAGEVGDGVPWVVVVPRDAGDLAAFVTAALRELDRGGGLGALRARWRL